MIVSRKWGFAFIKTMKTAGTSVEIALSAVCGRRDIITPIMEDEVITRARGPQRTKVPLSRRAICHYLQDGRWPQFYNHIPLATAVEFLPEVRGLFTFTIERNPWDKAVSLYWFATRDERHRPTFSCFLRQNRAMLSNFPLYAIDGRIAVDRVIRYESLREELGDVWSVLGLPDRPNLSNAKSEYRRPLSIAEEDAEFIREECRLEIEHFGFEMPDSLRAHQ